MCFVAYNTGKIAGESKVIVPKNVTTATKQTFIVVEDMKIIEVIPGNLPKPWKPQTKTQADVNFIMNVLIKKS